MVNDASTDGTAEEARSKGARVALHPYRKENWAAVKTGIRAATRDYVVLMDADGQHDPADIEKLLEHLGTYELAVGARLAGSGQPIPPSPCQQHL